MNRHLSRTLLRSALAALVAVVCVACPESAAAPVAVPAPPKLQLAPQAESTPAEILARAQTAHGGAAALTAVTSLHMRSTLSRGAAQWESEVHFSQPNGFLQRIDTGDVVITHGCDGTAVWAALDGTPVPLADSERATLQEQLLLLRPDFLVAAADPARMKVTRAKVPGPLLHVDAEPLQGPGGPWRLSFDPTTHLLSAITLQADAAGRTYEMRLSDFRRVGAVQTPWLASWFHGTQETATNRVTAMEHSVPIDAALFHSPALIAPSVHEGCSSEGPVLTVATTDWAAGAAALDDFLQRAKLERAGPITAECKDGRIVSMSLGLAALPPPVSGPLPEDAVHSGTKPRQRHLRQLVLGKTVEEVLDQPQNLHAVALERGLRPAGSLRVVQWGAGFWIVQLPLEN